jgi:nucleoside-diphosphate-sugar epimerase
MKIVVTGATGFLGGAVSRHLVKNGHSVRAIGRSERAGMALKADGVEFFQADIVNRPALDKIFAGCDLAIHCAALASPFGPYEIFHRANVLGTQNVLDAALTGNVRRIVNISTPSVYFDFKHRVGIKESDPLPSSQVTNYAQTKLIADGILHNASEIEVISLRPRAIFGPGDTTILGRILAISSNGIMTVIGNGRSLIDMTYIDNVVDAIILAMNAPSSCSGKFFNITNGEPIANIEMLKMLFTCMKRKIRYRHIPYPLAYGIGAASEWIYRILGFDTEPKLTRYAVGLLAYDQTLDISAAKSELGYRPTVNLQNGFERFAASRR